MGKNCEVSHAIIQSGFNLESSLLNWSYINSDKILFKTISNPLGVFSGEYTWRHPSLIRCDVLEAVFHTRRRIENFKELNKDDPELLSQVTELKSRCRYLAAKFQSQMKGPQVVNAFVKLPAKTKGGLYEFCRDLRQIIDNTYPGNKVRLWIVVEGRIVPFKYVDELNEVNIVSVSEFAKETSSNQFSQQALNDWRSFISLSENI